MSAFLPRLPEHLQRRDGTYHFRMRVPENLRTVVGKREFRQSLGTSDFSEAKRLLPMQRFKALAELEAARRLLSASLPKAQITERTFTDDDLWSLMTVWFVEKQKDGAKLGIERIRPQDRLEELTYATDPDDTNFPAAIHSTTQKFLAQQGVTLNPRSDAFRRLSEMIHEAWIENEKRLIRRFLGDGGGDLNPRFSGLTASTILHPGAKLTLDQLIARFEADHAMAVSAPKTNLKRTAQFRLFRSILGADTPLCKIGREEARSLQQAILRLPANATKRFPKLALPQLLELPDAARGRTMSAHTANAYVMSFSALMEFAVNEQLIEKNPAKGLHIASDGPKARDERLPFTIADLTAIFSAPIFVGCMDDLAGYSRVGPNKPRRGRFWVPLIALFSGLRMNEICQLEVDDICVLAGCDVILVRPSEDGSRKLKTAAANRVVPIHPELKKFGFLTYVENKRREGMQSKRLFPELQTASTGYISDNFSKWFARFLDHVGVVHPRKNFHSFRHNFRDALREANVPVERARLLGGWSNGGSDARYGGAAETMAIMLSEEVGKVSYPALRLKHLCL